MTTDRSPAGHALRKDRAPTDTLPQGSYEAAQAATSQGDLSAYTDRALAGALLVLRRRTGTDEALGRLLDERRRRGLVG